MDLNKKNPAALAGAYRDKEMKTIYETEAKAEKRAKQARVAITVQSYDGERFSFEGREAWALNTLIQAGERGCSTIDRPAPRLSAYVHKLRKAGLIIETINERHRGQFPGTHGRYVLRSEVKPVELRGV